MNGCLSRMHLACGILMILAAPLAAGEQEFVYLKRDGRDATRIATLSQYMPTLTLGDWYVVGPFDNVGMDKHDVIYPPEMNRSEIDTTASYAARDGISVAWQRIETDDWPLIALKRFGSEPLNENGVAYLFCTFESDQALTLPFNAGSDDGLKLWVNGKLLIDADLYRGFNIQDHRIDVPIRAGRNTVLAKVTQGTGGWEFQMKPVVDNRMLARLEYHLNRDFPKSRELEHYQLLSVLEPEDVVLEVGGVTLLPDGRPVITTRRGEVWVVNGAYDDPPFDAEYVRYAFGLHEPLGAWWRDGGVYVTQRGEVTKLVDADGDDRVDRYLTISDGWGVSGNYHEFAFGPEEDGQGRLWITLNVGFCGGLGKSIVPWRGWALIVNEDGSVLPVCGGLRSPNGLGRNAEGEMFATDNQGDWVGTNKLMHLAPGDWHGHPSSFRWYETAGFETPEMSDFKPPAIWFPYDRMGRSASDILLDDTGGRFGPFDGQLFVGDQYAAEVMRVDLEEVNGVWQGACFKFMSGFDSGVNRLCWGEDGSLFVGMTNRGWWSKGPRGWGLQRVVFRGTDPFEMRTMRARPDGFEITFTRPVDQTVAADPARYTMASFTHERWEKYGSPEIEAQKMTVTAVDVAADGRSVRLHCGPLRPGFVHELVLNGILDTGGEALLHDSAWYTLNEVPQEAASQSRHSLLDQESRRAGEQENRRAVEPRERRSVVAREPQSTSGAFCDADSWPAGRRYNRDHHDSNEAHR